MKALHNHPECTDLIHDFLSLISEGMIRIRSRERKTCGEVAETLRKLFEECNGNPGYGMERTPGFLLKRGTNKSNQTGLRKKILDRIMGTSQR